MEGQAEQGRTVLAAAARLIPPALAGPDRSPEIPAGRLLLGTLAFGTCYAVLVPGLWLVFLALLTGGELFRLLLSVLLVPVLAALGFVALLRGLLPIGLLLGALAARLPEVRWPRLLAAALLPGVDLILFQLSGLPRLVGHLLALLMDGWTLFVLQFGAPVAASVLACALVPERLLQRALGAGRTEAVVPTGGSS